MSVVASHDLYLLCACETGRNDQTERPVVLLFSGSSILFLQNHLRIHKFVCIWINCTAVKYKNNLSQINLFLYDQPHRLTPLNRTHLYISFSLIRNINHHHLFCRQNTTTHLENNTLKIDQS